MKELFELNDKLFYSESIRKDKFKNHISLTLTIASAYSFTGVIIIKITRKLKFARNIKQSKLLLEFKDKYFLKVMENIEQISDRENVEDLVLYLISIGFYDILKKVDFLSKIINKYKLLKE